MTFKEIKQGDTVYILDKGKLDVKQGTVVATKPHLNNGLGMFTQAQGQLMVDVTIETEGNAPTYTIPEHLAVTYAGDIVLSTDPKGLATEVERMKTEAERILASVDRQRTVIKKSSDLLARLNPEMKAKRETEKRFERIENGMGSIQGMMQKILAKLEGTNL